MDGNDVIQAMQVRLKEQYPQDEVYTDRLPKDFVRPSFTLELQKNDMTDANRFLVKRMAVVLVTCYERVNAFYDSSREAMNRRQDQVLALFSQTLRVKGRTLLPTAQKGEGTPGYNEVTVTFAWVDSRPGLVDEDTAPESQSGIPHMADFGLRVGTEFLEK